MLETAILPLIAGVALAGVASQWIGWRTKIPSIIPLLLIGLIAGPLTGMVRPAAILGEIMHPAIGLAVAIIMFEGGLNLNVRELRSAASGVSRLVLVALPLNGVFGALAGHYLGGLSWPVAILFGSILVVTGPTVIMPLLRQARLDPRAASFLKWEAIVNDPIGATMTLIILSYLVLAARIGAAGAVFSLAWHTLLGAALAAALGVAVPFAIRWTFHRDLMPEYLKTPLLLACAIGIYVAGEILQPETGLIGATLFGVMLANLDITGLQELRRFKESLTVFLVSGLFILLTANIDPDVLGHLGLPIIVTTLVVLFVVRPLAIGLATIGAHMTWRERVLVGWIGPRGVVAAAIAGVASEQLVKAGYADGVLILPMVFAVIAATVLLHGLSLSPLARRLGLASDGRSGLLIVGSSPWSVSLAEALRRLDVPVLIADRSNTRLRPARRLGLPTLRGEILSVEGEERSDLRAYDYLLAATQDDAYNALVCTRFAPELGRERVHQLSTSADRRGEDATAREWRGKIAFHADLDHARLSALHDKRYRFSAMTLVDGDLPEEENRWPVLVVSKKGPLIFFSPDAPVEAAPGDVVLSLAPIGESRRRFQWRGRLRPRLRKPIPEDAPA